MKWEYHLYAASLTLFTSQHGQPLYIRDLNKLGAEGWELVSVTLVHSAASFLFKRPLLDVETKQ